MDLQELREAWFHETRGGPPATNPSGAWFHETRGGA